MRNAVFYNGELYAASDCALSPLSRALHYGDGVFETMRGRNGCVFRLAAHLERLCSGLRLLRIPLPDCARLETAVADVLRANALAEARVKLIVFRDGPPGPTPPAPQEPCVLITAEPLGSESLKRCREGISARIADIRRDEACPLSAIKSLNYLCSVIARMQAADHGDTEALLLNRQGNVAEGATSNVFIVSSGRLLTPAISAGALPGITRAVVCEIAQELRIPCDEADITSAQLAGAEEIFLTNAAAGVMPLTRLDGEPVGSGRPGPVTLSCQAAYDRLFEQETESLP